MINHFIIALVVVLVGVNACQKLRVSSEVFGDIFYNQVFLDNVRGTDVFTNGRAVYQSVGQNRTTYIYHSQVHSNSGLGRWILNDEFGVPDKALAFVSSWAVEPYLVSSVNDNPGSHYWRLPDEEGVWTPDTTFEVTCEDSDKTLFFESSVEQPLLTGFYVERRHSKERFPVYSKIVNNKDDPRIYLYKVNDIWMIGEQIGVDAGYAFVRDDASFPGEIENTEWHYVASDANSTWIVENNQFIHKNISSAVDGNSELEFDTVYEALRYIRSIKYIPTGQLYYSMRNNVPIPVIGLGTGGLPHEHVHDVMQNALSLGYRFLDLGEEYQNEHLVPEVLASLADQPEAPRRRDVFLQSKVWPTHLGFETTLESIRASIKDLQTTFLDSYLIHWPRCDSQVEWMHCENIVDPDGTWQESWYALERAYAEGLVNSIGVSNFDIDLLEDLASFSSNIPHIVQNYADLSYLDLDVRTWCGDNNVIYQPYASGRNIGNLPEDRLKSLRTIGEALGKSEYALNLRFFVQSGAVVIPRSVDNDHLKENLQVFAWSISEQDMADLGWSNKASRETDTPDVHISE